MVHQKTNNQENIRKQLISSISGIFSHERADSQLTKHFLDCNDISHKTECIIKVLESSVDTPDVFFSKVTTIIRLHSNVMKEKPKLTSMLNNELRLVGLSYDVDKSQLIIFNTFEPYIMGRKYIDIDKAFLPNPFYHNLVNEINWCYNTRANTATMVLIRKMFENLLLDILRKKYQDDPSKEKLYWNEKKQRHPRFLDLIKNLEKQQEGFKKYSTALDDLFFEFLHTLREKGNKGAHTIEEVVSSEYMDEIREKIVKNAQILLVLLGKI